MQNINFITQFSFSILKLFETFLAIPTKINGINSYVSLMFICKQTINFISAFFLEIAKKLQTSNFGYFWHTWLRPKTTILPTCRKLSCLSSCKKSYLSLAYFLKYYTDIATLLFWIICYFGSQVIPLICRRLWSLSAKKQLEPSMFYR